MKYLLVLFGLIAASSATHPATETCKNKIAACLESGPIILLPDIIIQSNINLLGMVVIEVSIEVDFSPIAALVRLGTELSYNETSSGGVVTASISIGVAVGIDLNLNAEIIVKLLGLIQIGVGSCVITIVDLDITINVIATFADGDAANCKMKQITVDCNKSSCIVSNSGNANVDLAMGNSKNNICNLSYDYFEDALQNILDNCVEV
ncbi:uncharacterized protein [Onthophagus taurus]|uniref:uncharacterized protein n=1 Tax=Onthophagus taurus TaxID=166361 RepID=UPI000C20BBAB|nr:uncharacterized protein LOC111417431 [Onthophagus taurus]XP_022906999.1 uncharacterized protein LOC111418630 [Onthophagus taurus]